MTGREIGGVVPSGRWRATTLVSGDHLQLVELRLAAGFYHARHNHPEHESAGFVVQGRLEMIVGDERHILSAGSAWHHGIGVYHSTRALEDTHALEAHSPPRTEYLPPTPQV